MFVPDEKKRMAAGEKIKSNSHCGQRTYEGLWSIGNRIWNCQLETEKSLELKFPRMVPDICSKGKCVNWKQTHILFSRDIFRPRSRLPTEKTLMLNKPSSRLNINKNTLGPSVLMKLILEGKFKNKTQMIHFQIYSIRRLSWSRH